MTPERAEQTYESRLAMLHSVETDISAELVEALGAKLRYEHTVLLQAAQAQAAAAERTNELLDVRYFVRKTFDADVLDL